MKRLLKFLFWPGSRKKLLVRTFFTVLAVRLGLSLFAFRTLSTWLSGFTAPDRCRTEWDVVREITTCVRFCSQFVPYATCLTQALATQLLLKRVGQNSELKIGVDKDENERLIAHAWIEVEGKIVIGKLRDIRRYSIMAHGMEQVV